MTMSTRTTALIKQRGKKTRTTAKPRTTPTPATAAEEHKCEQRHDAKQIAENDANEHSNDNNCNYKANPRTHARNYKANPRIAMS